jgi:hypothetical protein
MELIKNNSSLSTVEIDLARQIYQINLLIPYPLTDSQIEDFSRTLQELVPELTPAQLKRMIDRFKMGIYEWDRNKMIQNIFKYVMPVICEDEKDPIKINEIRTRIVKPTQVSL